MEGAFVQGLGLFTLEELHYSPEGSLYTRGPSTYKIPAFGSIPTEFRVSLLRDCPNKKAIYASKVLLPWVCAAFRSALWETTRHGGLQGARMEEREKGLGQMMGGQGWRWGEGGGEQTCLGAQGTGLRMTPPPCHLSQLSGCTQRDSLGQSCRSSPDLHPRLRCASLRLGPRDALAGPAPLSSLENQPIPLCTHFHLLQ